MVGRTQIQGAVDLQVEKLDSYLRTRIPGLETLLRIERIGGGQSNPTYRLRYDNRDLILRRRPDGDILPSAHAVDREFKVQRSLMGSAVPVPEMLVYEDSPDVAKTAFYVMGFVEGRIFDDNTLNDAAKSDRRKMYRNLAQVLSRIHAVDVASAGLSDFGKVGGYFERQIRRWSRQWELSKAEDNPAIDLLTDWLQRHLPSDDRTTLVHGDYRIGNVVFHPDKPQIVAVLDWELSTLGHPMADLAHSCVYMWMTDSHEFGAGLRDVDLSAHGLPSMEEFVADYQSASAVKSEMTTFHLAFALFRNAVIFEGIADRARRGNASATNAAEVGRLAPLFAQRGADLIDSDFEVFS